MLEDQTDWSRDAIFEACKQKEAMEKEERLAVVPAGHCPCPARFCTGGGTDLAAAMMGKEETLRRLNAAIEAL